MKFQYTANEIKNCNKKFQIKEKAILYKGINTKNVVVASTRECKNEALISFYYDNTGYFLTFLIYSCVSLFITFLKSLSSSQSSRLFIIYSTFTHKYTLLYICTLQMEFTI